MIHNKLENLTPTQQPRTSIWNGPADFWMLGGLSIVVCILMHLTNLFREDVPVFQMRFLQLGTVFSLLSLICNHPHFMISYRFGYGRGSKFIFENWFALILIPLSLIAANFVAYIFFQTDISESLGFENANTFFKTIGLTFTVGGSGKLGEEIMAISIWVMYLTVGWHYSKQAYGCMMVYAIYDGYTLSALQKQIFKWSTITLAVFQFVWMARSIQDYAPERIGDSRFQGIHLSTMGLPGWMTYGSLVVMILSALLGIGIIFKIFKNTRRWSPIPISLAAELQTISSEDIFFLEDIVGSNWLGAIVVIFSTQLVNATDLCGDVGWKKMEIPALSFQVKAGENVVLPEVYAVAELLDYYPFQPLLIFHYGTREYKYIPIKITFNKENGVISTEALTIPLKIMKSAPIPFCRQYVNNISITFNPDRDFMKKKSQGAPEFGNIPGYGEKVMYFSGWDKDPNPNVSRVGGVNRNAEFFGEREFQIELPVAKHP